MNDGNQGKEVITFYSFKGGTGRTMALANLAILTARLQKKVLLIDWDLEAPGLHRYFSPYITRTERDLNDFPGLIDFFVEVSKLIPSTNERKIGLSDKEIIGVLNKIDISQYIVNTELQGLSLLKAGAFTNEYPKCISQFQWEKLFQNVPNFFPIFCNYLKEIFDFIYIDSRTGFTDTSGICTMLMPEKLCLVFTPNLQSLEGVIGLAKKALEYRMNSSDFRPLKIYPIPSRVELAEKDLRDNWRKGFNNEYQVISGRKIFRPIKVNEYANSKDSSEFRIEGFQPSFEKLFNECYDISNCDLTNYFDIIQIHHEPKYSYGEELAVLTENYSDRLSLTIVYKEILQKLLFESKIYSEKEKKLDSSDKIRDLYSSSNDRKIVVFVDQLKTELQKTGRFHIDSPKSEDVKAGEDFLKQIEENILASQIVLPIISKNYLGSKLGDVELYLISKSINSQSGNMAIPIFLEDISRRDFSSTLLDRIQGIYLSQYSGVKEIVEEVIRKVEANKTLFSKGQIEKKGLYKIFLASSSELKDDREQLEIFISRQSKTLYDKGVDLELAVWENFLDAMSESHSQEEFNNAINKSDVIIFLFFTKIGKHTVTEFETVFGEFKKTGKPLILIYLKNAPANLTSDSIILAEFKAKLGSLGHFYSRYYNIDDLKIQVKAHLERLYIITDGQ